MVYKLDVDWFSWFVFIAPDDSRVIVQLMTPNGRSYVWEVIEYEQR